MRISDWSSDVCSSDLAAVRHGQRQAAGRRPRPGPHTRGAGPVRGRHVALTLLSRLPRELLVLLVRAYQLLVSPLQIGRASCMERESQYVSMSVVAVALKKKPKYRNKTEQSNTR